MSLKLHRYRICTERTSGINCQLIMGTCTICPVALMGSRLGGDEGVSILAIGFVMEGFHVVA